MKTFFLSFFLVFAVPVLQAQCDFTPVVITTTTVDWGEELGWEVLNESEMVLATFQADANNTTYVSDLCLEDGCYLLHATDTYGDGWNGGSVAIDIDGTVLNYALTTGDEGFYAFGVNTAGCVVEIPGCTDPAASNYNPVATVDDGSCMTVAEVLAEQSITWLIQSGPSDNRINWAIQNRGMPNDWDEFTDEAEFVQMLTDSIVPPFILGSDLEKTPYARYRNFFNLQAWWWPDAPSTETGWNWPLLKGLRDAYFLPWADEEHGWATLFSISKYGGGGGAGVQPDTRTGDGLMYGTGWETLLHEFGHTMPQVPDEYTASGEWSGGQCWEGANTTGHLVRDSIPWRNWIEEDTPLPTPYEGEYVDAIGAFEGALTNYFGCHRPTARACYMGAGGFGPEFGTDLCAPCRQRVICHLYKYVDVIENPIPATPSVTALSGETITFGADFVKPEPNTQTYAWMLNGQIISDQESVDITFGSCPEYELRLTVRDTTSWVRYDAAFDHIYPEPREEHTWIISISDAIPSALEATAIPSATDCLGGASGQVALSASGGAAPYSFFYGGMEIAAIHSELEAGSYDYWIQDAGGCASQTQAEVTSSPVLEVELCSSFDGNNWDVNAEISGYMPAEVSASWSSGETGLVADELDAGDYTLLLTVDATSCEVELPFSLSDPGSDVSVSHEAFACAYQNGVVDPANANGRIDLTLSGGNPAYDISWSWNAAADLTVPNPAVIMASGSTWDHYPEYAFDDDIYTKWLHFVSSDAWIAQEFPDPVVVKYYTVMSGDDVPGRDPKNWLFEGSNDGVNWTVLDSRFNEDFAERRQTRLFLVENETAYSWYRFYVTENHGDGSIQLQELEFVAVDPQGVFQTVPESDELTSLTGLAPGAYAYAVEDQNSGCAADTVLICAADAFVVTGLNVIQESLCSVTLETIDVSLDYYWLSDEDGSEILGEGTSFTPPAGGNYWVAAADPVSGAFSSNRPGFAVSMAPQPVVQEVSAGEFEVVDPDPDFIYSWYTEECGVVPVAEGSTFIPGPDPGTFYVSSYWATPFPDPVDPAAVSGLIVRMDAADLDGDGIVDDPQLPDGSLYDWSFTPSNGWGDWFAYRGNAQNGLGIADFATIWLQGMQEGINGYRTVIMAYRENLMTFPGRAPFEGLSPFMPYSGTPELSLYEADLPPETAGGSTWLNGEEVDPLTTANPMNFCVLGQRLAGPGNGIYYTDTHWEGAAGEILFYDQEISDSEMIGISEFLRRKWISTADLESPKAVVVWDGLTCTCAGDFNGDCTIGVSDLLFLLADFACLGTCDADINGNGATDSGDILILLSSFGTDCE